MMKNNNSPPVSEQTGVKKNYAYLHHIKYELSSNLHSSKFQSGFSGKDPPCTFLL
jgi:hypothetical protein